MKKKILVMTFVMATAAITQGCYRLTLELKEASVQKPSNVALYFAMSDRDENPVSGHKANQFKIFEDGKLISIYESKQTILNPKVATVRYTLLLLDMSGSVVDSGQMPVIQEAVAEFIQGLGEDEHVAIYAFDGREEIQPIAKFGTSETAASKRAERLGNWKAEDPSTNLNGAVIKAVEVLEEAKSASDVPLRFGTLVVFTDGTDRAHRASSRDAQQAMEENDIDSYVIGIGGEVDEEELQSLFSNGVLHFTEKEKVVVAFKEMGEKLKAMGSRYYLLSYCSPSRAGRHELTIETEKGKDKGKLNFSFDADGFEPGCDPYDTPNFKPLEDAKKSEAARQRRLDKGMRDQRGNRQAIDDESPFSTDEENPPPPSY
jgi:hypothetical protein